jgi:hypothetical protein
MPLSYKYVGESERTAALEKIFAGLGALANAYISMGPQVQVRDNGEVEPDA